MKDKFEELVEELNLNEIEDFELQPAMYQVWMLGYDENEAITDFEVMVNESRDAEYAVEYAKKFVDEERYLSNTFPPEVSYIEVLVETVIETEDDIERNDGTLFTTTIKIK